MMNGGTLRDIFTTPVCASSEEKEAWQVIEAAGDLISAHYGLDRDEVWSAILALEIEVAEECGLSNFGHLLERPWGFAGLGIRVAQVLLGEVEAARLPALHLGYQ